MMNGDVMTFGVNTPQTEILMRIPMAPKKGRNPRPHNPRHQDTSDSRDIRRPDSKRALYFTPIVTTPTRPEHPMSRDRVFRARRLFAVQEEPESSSPASGQKSSPEQEHSAKRPKLTDSARRERLKKAEEARAKKLRALLKHTLRKMSP